MSPKKIFWVDEDRQSAEGAKILLQAEGYELVHYTSAIASFYDLCDLDSTSTAVVVIDVMLLSGVSSESSELNSIFSAENTKDFRVTGVILLETLTEKNPAVFPAKAVLYSRATDHTLRAEISHRAKKLSARLFWKDGAQDPIALAQKVAGFCN